MKKLIAVILPLFFLSFYVQAAVADTTIAGVHIQFSYEPSIFPDSWLGGAINGQGENIEPGEISRTQSIIIKALKKYPASMLQANLKAVYFLKSMKFYDVGFGGTNSADALYLTNNGIPMGFTDAYIEQTFHHEFSSILFRNFPAFLDTAAWKNANIPGFDYNDPEAGVGAIRNNQSSQEADTLLCKKGFLTQYAYSSLENDVNTLAQNLFRPGSSFWEITDNYPRIRKKVTLLINFYHSIDAVFTEPFFRKFENL
jgi:hypothetical protein